MSCNLHPRRFPNYFLTVSRVSVWNVSFPPLHKTTVFPSGLFCTILLCEVLLFGTVLQRQFCILLPVCVKSLQHELCVSRQRVLHWDLDWFSFLRETQCLTNRQGCFGDKESDFWDGLQAFVNLRLRSVGETRTPRTRITKEALKSCIFCFFWVETATGSLESQADSLQSQTSFGSGVQAPE